MNDRRVCTAGSCWLSIKTYKPIASVAAFPERLWQLQLSGKYRRPCNVPKFVIARPQRGRVISQSPVGSHRKTPQLSPRDCTPRALPRASRSGRHVASPLAMTHQGGAAVGTVHSAELALLLLLRELAGHAAPTKAYRPRRFSILRSHRSMPSDTAALRTARTRIMASVLR